MYEIQVLQDFKNYSQTQELGWKIFHDVPIREEKLSALAEAFGTVLPNFDPIILSTFRKSKITQMPIVQIEIDVLVISKTCITLIEVKSNADKGTFAIEQLKKAEHLISILCQIVGLDKVPIKKIVAAPNPLQWPKTWPWPLLESSQKNNTLLFPLDTWPTPDKNLHLKNEDPKHEFLKKLCEFNTDPTELEEDSIHNIMSALAFMKCSYHPKEQRSNFYLNQGDLSQALLEANKGRQILRDLEVQSVLEKANSQNKKFVAKKYPSSYLWLDPIQIEVMKDQNNRQIIYGPASTGKTLLIQLKVIELFEKYSNPSVLIILPFKKLVQMYEQYFEESNISKSFYKGTSKINYVLLFILQAILLNFIEPN